MKVKQAEQFLKKNKKIEGWFSIHDVVAFSTILSIQSDLKTSGSLLEIGVYQGTSAILVGKFSNSETDFEVCDIFQLDSDTENKSEISSSYRNLNREIFENNCRENLAQMPIIHECKSLDLRSELESDSYRFIHIDGSHLYEHVVNDIQLALDVLAPEDSVIAMDDFRSQHTLGVTHAIWEKIISGGFTPFLATPAKLYLARNLVNMNQERVHKALVENGIHSISENIGNYQILRTLDLPDGKVYETSNFLRDLLPPIFIKFIRKFL